MKNILLTILATILLISTKLTGAEIVPVWNKVNEVGIIHDMEFLKGENQFILLAGLGEEGQIQIRDTQSGELVSSFPFPTLGQFNQIEITPDSNRCIITTGGNKQLGPTIELRNLSDCSLISKDSLIMDDEAKDPQGNPYYYAFHDMIVDPIRPLVYVMIEKTNFFSNSFEDRFYLKVYNYETMELVRDLTPVGYEKENLKCFDVSDDGRYLAALNEGKAYLKVWDLESYELIKDYQLYDSKLTNPKDYRCEVSDIEFSSIDDDLIYFSGVFPNVENKPFPNGFFKYSKSNNTNALINIGERYNRGLFTLFDQEKRIFISSGVEISIINQELLKEELNVNSGVDIPLAHKLIYSIVNNSFNGFAFQYYVSVKYDTETYFINNYEEEITISPNPTNSLVNITLECQESIIAFNISDINGISINQSTIENQGGSFQFDFSPYTTGVYFLTIDCNSSKSYKIIKEN